MESASSQTGAPGKEILSSHFILQSCTTSPQHCSHDVTDALAAISANEILSDFGGLDAIPI